MSDLSVLKTLKDRGFSDVHALLSSHESLEAQVRSLKSDWEETAEKNNELAFKNGELEEEKIQQTMTIEDLKREILFMENPRIDGDCYEDEEKEA